MKLAQLKTVTPNFINNIDKTIPFVVWSRPGSGALAHVMEQFNVLDYHILRISTPVVDESDILQHFDMKHDEHPLPNSIEAARKDVENNGKKLVVIFDELSFATKHAVFAFNTAFMDREVLGLKLHKDDVILGMGTLDEDNKPLSDTIHFTIYNHLRHYVIDFNQTIGLI
jgi:hypothetical protein